MAGQFPQAATFLQAATSAVCAYCGAPLALAAQGMRAWRVGDQFACNEFCAEGIALSGDIIQKSERAADMRSERLAS
jgi:hypothetical protein